MASCSQSQVAKQTASGAPCLTCAALSIGGFATTKDPATNHITRGWCRLMGLTPLILFTTTLLIVRNQRILTTWDARRADNARRAAAGLPPRTRKRRRKTLTMLATATRPP